MARHFRRECLDRQPRRNRRRGRNRPLLRHRTEGAHRPGHAAGKQRHPDGQRYHRRLQPHLSQCRHRRRAPGHHLHAAAIPRSSSATTTSSASASPSTAPPKKKKGSPASASTISSWPAATSPTIANWATTSSSPTTPCWRGHVHVHDHASLSGAVAVHHFATIGSYSFVAGLSAIRHDVPPYMLVEGYPGRPRCINAVGLKRNKFLAASDSGPLRSPPPALPLEGRPGKRLGNPPRQRSTGAAGQPLLSFIQGQHEGLHGRGRERRRAA